MKTFTKLSKALLFTILISSSIIAQPVYDVVTIGQGYTNQSFYSLANGEVSNELNTNWDLAFQISGFQASILVNGKNNVRLFRSGLDVNAWSNITANDTIGKMNPDFELHNQDTSWWAGAFNITNNPLNAFDLGWGVYDFATHVVVGDSLYFIKLSTGNVKKLWIQALQNGVYTFVYADVDGSNEVNASLNKQNFSGKNFGYYSINNGTTLDREPNKSTWDLTFMQYMATTPFTYKVTGILTNDSVTSVKVYPVDVVTAEPWGQTFSKYINTIGYDWKSYDFNNNAWAIQDSVVYFVYGRPGGLWKMTFTGFSGASSGDFEFFKEQVSSTGINENGGQPALLNVYPNPASTQMQMTIYVEQFNAANTASIHDVTGKLVKTLLLPTSAGLQEIVISTSDILSGIYFINLTVDGVTSTKRFAIVK